MPHPEQRIFGVGCVMTANTKKSIFGAGRHQPTPKMAHFYKKRVSDSLAGAKDWLPADTTNCFCSSGLANTTMVAAMTCVFRSSNWTWVSSNGAPISYG
jgi:hypothetical protein